MQFDEPCATFHLLSLLHWLGGMSHSSFSISLPSTNSAMLTALPLSEIDADDIALQDPDPAHGFSPLDPPSRTTGQAVPITSNALGLALEKTSGDA